MHEGVLGYTLNGKDGQLRPADGTVCHPKGCFLVQHGSPSISKQHNTTISVLRNVCSTSGHTAVITIVEVRTCSLESMTENDVTVSR